MTDMDKSNSVNLFYEYLRIFSFKYNTKLLKGKFMWKLVNAVHPNSISEKFPITYSKAINNHQNKLVNHTAKDYTGYRLLNQKVATDIKSVKTIKAFNKAYRKLLLRKSMPDNLKIPITTDIATLLILISINLSVTYDYT